MGHEEVQADVKNHEGHEEHEDFGTHIPAIVRGSFVKGPSSYKILLLAFPYLCELSAFHLCPSVASTARSQTVTTAPPRIRGLFRH